MHAGQVGLARAVGRVGEVLDRRGEAGGEQQPVRQVTPSITTKNTKGTKLTFG